MSNRFAHLINALAILALIAPAIALADGAQPAADYPSAYNEIWTTPSKDAAGSMPLGNGQVGINLWAQDDGEIRFYISRTDSFSEISRLLKVGGARIAFTPNPFADQRNFRQELLLRDGACLITAGDPGRQISVRVFVDADRPVVHVIGQSPAGVTVKASIDSWRRQPHKIEKAEGNSAWTLSGAPFDLIEAADVFLSDRPDTIGWYHRNESSPAFDATLKLQSLESFAGSKVRDPLIHRTFGGWMTAPNFAPADQGNALQSPGPVQQFHLRIAAPCMQTDNADDWLSAARKIAADSADPAEALKHTAAWWHAYWDRAHIITDASAGGTIPQNAFPLRVGRDSYNGNRFRGEIGRRSVFNRALSDEDVAKLAGTEAHAPCPLPGAPASTADGDIADLPATSVNVANAFTLEAWIKPATLSPARIFDKITAGGSDGFLLDIAGKQTLRWIAGGTTLAGPADLLKPNQWQHVAVSVDPRGLTRVYLNGKPIAETGNNRTSPIARGYALQRYVQACGGRGPVPIKFNGGIFTVEPAAMGRPFNPDYRAWGDAFWWQNTRHMYHPMAAAGDLDMTDPLFDMFDAARPLAEARTQLYHRAQGAYFPETMTFWGTYANGDFGWNRKHLQPYECASGYWRYAWNQGPELVGLMLDRWDFQQDAQFLKTRLLPMAQSVLMYFDTRFKKDANGRIIIDPAQAVETYWHGVINDMPTVAMLIDITARLSALPENLTTAEQRAFFAHMKSAAPEFPVEEVKINDQPRRMLSPAQKYDPKRSNCENPELYGVWPARVAALGTPLLEEGRLAYAKRHANLPNGWGYDGNAAALLGLSDEAARILSIKCRNSHRAYRWPATWGPNFDWLPDQNHGGNLLETAQLMLLQPSGDKIRLLPAWPRDWDVTFKLHAPRNTTVECVYRAGRIESLIVTPQSRAADVLPPDFASK